MTEQILTYDFPETVQVDDRLVIKVAGPEHAEQIRLILEEDPDIRNHMGWMSGAYTSEELAERILAMRDGRNARYVVEHESRVVAYLGIWPSWKLPYENEYDLGYFVAKSARGQGVIQRSAEALMQEVASRMPVENFTVFILDSNLPSQSTAAQLGFLATEMVWEDARWGAERRYVRPVGDQATAS